MEAYIRGLVERLRNEHRFIEAAVVKYLDMLYEKSAEAQDSFHNTARAIKSAKDHWMRHIRFEENEVFPLLEGHGIVEELKAEHREAEALYSRLEAERDVEKWRALLRELLHLKRRHLSKESRLVPLLEKMAEGLRA